MGCGQSHSNAYLQNASKEEVDKKPEHRLRQTSATSEPSAVPAKRTSSVGGRRSVGPRAARKTGNNGDRNSSSSETSMEATMNMLGEEADAAKPPTAALLVTGPQSSGKSTLIRQIKHMYDGAGEDADRKKYSKEVHKLALAAFQEMLKCLKLDDLGDEEKETAELVLAMKRRDPIASDVAARLAELCAKQQCNMALSALADPQLRQTCRYFIGRLEALGVAGFLPEPEDLLYLNVPTVGRLGSRVQGTPSGALSVTEMSFAEYVDSFDGSKQNLDKLKGEHFSGVIFAASLIDLAGFSTPSTAAANEDETKTVQSAESKTAAIVQQWATVKRLCDAVGVPFFTVLSKSDVLSRLLQDGAMDQNACSEQALLARLTSNAPTGKGVGAQQLQPALPRAVSLLDTTSTMEVIKAVLRVVLQLDEEEESTEKDALQEGVYLALAVFAPAPQGSDQLLLTHQGKLPIVKMQAEPLNVDDHTWLQQLPMTIEMPAKLSVSDAVRFGKGSACTLSSNFWGALTVVADKLGPSCKLDSLGGLHTMPLLISPGTLLLMICREVASASAIAADASRGLKWLPRLMVANKISVTMPASELQIYRSERLRSYIIDVQEQKTLQVKEQTPNAWLGKVHKAAAKRSQPVSLTPGTYISALYLQSRIGGFHVLLSDAEARAMPAIKISNKLLTADEWAELRAILHAVGNAEVEAMPADWAKAKSWMGPDVTPESGFAVYHKFFYGVICLRRILGRRCSPMNDELRYSKSMDAKDSLDALGRFSSNLVTLDESGTVQTIWLAKAFMMGTEGDSFPLGLRWHPLVLFEANHFSAWMPSAYQLYCRARQVHANAVATAAHAVVKFARAPSSSSVCSAGEGSGCGSGRLDGDETGDDGDREKEKEEAAVLKGQHEAAEKQRASWGERIEALWAPFRWTRTLVRLATAEDEAAHVPEEEAAAVLAESGGEEQSGAEGAATATGGAATATATVATLTPIGNPARVAQMLRVDEVEELKAGLLKVISEMQGEAAS